MISRKSICMPTVKKKRPRSTPLNGSIAISIDFLYSVSARRMPATKAPSAIDSPAELAATPGRHNDKQGRSHERLACAVGCDEPEQRPEQNAAGKDDQAKTKESVRSRQGENRPNRGASSRAENEQEKQKRHRRPNPAPSRTARLVRPATVARRPCPARTSTTMAVEDNARQPPIMMDGAGSSPRSAARAAITAVETATCKLPSPKTRRRIAGACHRKAPSRS